MTANGRLRTEPKVIPNVTGVGGSFMTRGHNTTGKKKRNRNFADAVVLNINRMQNCQKSFVFCFYLKIFQRNWENTDANLTLTLCQTCMIN